MDVFEADTPSALATRLQALLAAHEREAAVMEVLRAVEAGLGVERLYDDVLLPLLRTLGAGWQTGQTAVWEEHMATQAIRSAVETLYPRIVALKAGVPPVPVTVAFFCPPDEAHDLGLRMLADRFDLHGFRTVYVGASTPVDDMVACAQGVSADVVCLSASTHFHRAALRHAVAALEAAVPGVRILVGGAAFVHDTDGWESSVPTDLQALRGELAAGASVSTAPGGE
jgi:methanogenic corrinoid protein MtbC1